MDSATNSLIYSCIRQTDTQPVYARGDTQARALVRDLRGHGVVGVRARTTRVVRASTAALADEPRPRVTERDLAPSPRWRARRLGRGFRDSAWHGAGALDSVASLGRLDGHHRRPRLRGL